MREQLREVSGQTVQFTAVVGRPGTVTTAWRADVTFLLEDLRFASDGSVAADHIWCKDGRWSSRLRPGDRIRSDARVVRYLKGYRGDDPVRRSESPALFDYRLEQPLRVVVLGRADEPGGR